MQRLTHRLSPKSKDLGDGFTVRRALPALEVRHIGPFIFLDEMGPVTFPAGQGLDVRPHPHIGLATVTYLFDGAIEHRDSLGTIKTIRPGDINWMTAGRGIVHSERSPQPRLGDRLHGIQFWVALPAPEERCEPAFIHTPAETLPVFGGDGYEGRVLIGALAGKAAPTPAFNTMLYVDVALAPGAVMAPITTPEELGVYVVEGALMANGERLEAHSLGVSLGGAGLTLAADSACRAIVFGGAPLDGPRRLWWNFVATDQALIDAAKADWQAQRLGVVPGETDFIPLPNA